MPCNPAIARCAVILALAPFLAAQSFVVDVNSGPGTNFTSLVAAVAAVPDGATLRVRPGNYLESVVVAAKGLTIAADAGANLLAPPGLPAMHVLGLAPTQTFVLRGLAMGAAGGGPGEVRLQNNRALVFLDSAQIFAWVHASQCDALLISRCFWNAQPLAAGTFDSCRTVIDACSAGELVQIGGELQLVDGAFTGRANLLGPGGAAVTMQGGSLRVLGTQLHGGFSLVATGRAIDGTGSVRCTPDAVLQGASPPVAPSIAMTTVAMPHVATSWITGSLHSVYATGPLGDLAFLVAAQRAMPQSLPGLDPLWLDAATARVEMAGVLTSGAFATMVVMPSSPALIGLSIVWQVIAFAPSGAMTVSNPTWLIVP